MMKIITDSVRPLLTYFFALTYMVISTWGVAIGKIQFEMYFAQIGTMVSMMISFWFGEKSALKNPKLD